MGRRVKKIECSNKDCIGYVAQEGGLCCYGMKGLSCLHRDRERNPTDFYSTRYIQKTPTAKLKWMIAFVRRGNSNVQAVFGQDGLASRRELKRRRGQCS